MSDTPIIETASTLSVEAVREILFHVLVLLAHRGVATEEQLCILAEIQLLEQPQLRVA